MMAGESGLDLYLIDSLFIWFRVTLVAVNQCFPNFERLVANILFKIIFFNMHCHKAARFDILWYLHSIVLPRQFH